MNDTSIHWALAVLKDLGHTITLTAYGWIVQRPGFSYLLGTPQAVIDLALTVAFK